MSLQIAHLETRPKNWSKPERKPTLIILQADEPEVTPDLVTVFRSDLEALFPTIIERANLPSGTTFKWGHQHYERGVCLVASARTYDDVYVIITPVEGE